MHLNDRRFRSLAATLVGLNLLAWLATAIDWHAPDRPRVRVLSALPAGEVDRTDRFTLVFDEQVVPEIEPGATLDTPLFQIEPQPDGYWTWSTPQRLEYVLREPLPPGHRFRISPHAAFARTTGRELVGLTTFDFRTRALELTRCALDSSDGRHGTLALHFNQPVRPGDLLEHLSFADGAGTWQAATEHGAACLSKTAATELAVRVPRPVSDRLRVRIGGGLAGADGNLPLARAVERAVQFRPEFELDWISATPDTFGEKTTVVLDFSHALDVDQTLSAFVIDPPVDDLHATVHYDEVRLRGSFACGRRYRIVVPSLVVARDGRTLARSETSSVEIPGRSPGLRMPGGHGVLSPRGNLALDLETVNVSGVEVTATRILPNNLAAHLHGARTATTAREVVTRRLALDGVPNATARHMLDLAALLPDARGVFLVGVRSTDDPWCRDTTLVTITDLAITAKQTVGGTLVWVTSLRDGRPVADARVVARSRNNQVLATGTSDADGIVRLDVPPGHPDGPAWLIVAETDDDRSYLETDGNRWVASDAAGDGRPVPEEYDVLLYTDRGLYRPGETIHLAGLVRDALGQVPPRFPLEVTLIRPDGRRVETRTIEHGPLGQGFLELDFATADDAQTGRYRFEVCRAGDTTVLAGSNALVECFVPVRMEVAATSPHERYTGGQSIGLDVSGRYLFDKQASGLPVVADLTYRTTPFESPDHAGYVFGFDRTDAAHHHDLRDALGADGTVRMSLPPPPADPVGRWTGHVSATVTEPGGRSVSATTSVIVDTAERYLGLLRPDNDMVASGEPIEFDWALVRPDGTSATGGTIEFELVSVHTRWELHEVNDRTVWRTIERTRALDHALLEPRGSSGRYVATCPEPGQYRLHATDRQTGLRSTIEFRAVDEGRAQRGLTLARPEELAIALDAEAFAAGGSATGTITAPSAGTLLLTLETDDVLHREVIEMSDSTIRFALPVPARMPGGGVVAATVVRPLDPERDTWVPHRARGMTRLTVAHDEADLPVKLLAATSAAPGATLPLTIEVANVSPDERRPVVQIWAVDDGILLAGGYDAPDPFGHFYAARAASVATADTLGLLLPDHRRPASIDRIGADGPSNVDALRSSPVPIRNRAPAVVWRGAEQLGPDGRLTIDLPVPNRTGRLRVLAVAAAGERFGAATLPMTVSAPLMLEASLPRFATPDDVFEVPLRLISTLPHDTIVGLTTALDGPLDLGALPNRIALPANSTETVWMTCSALDAGRASGLIQLHGRDADGRTLSATLDIDLPIRRHAELRSVSHVHRIAAGASRSLPPSEGFLPGSARTTLHIDGRPRVQLLPAVEALLDYPYGCLEQTTSRMIALLNGRDLIGRELPGDFRGARIDEMLAAGVARLWSMQTARGGLAYWPGNTQPHAWGSAYAAALLAEAEADGIAVPTDLRRDLARYLERALQADRDDNTRAALCHGLAALGRPPLGWMATLSDRADELDLGGRANLALAWLAARHPDRAEQVLPARVALDPVPLRTGGRITSEVRQIALLIDALCRIDPQHAALPRLVRHVEQRRADGRWGNTLENATALRALANYQAAQPDDDEFDGTVQRGDRTLACFADGLPVSLEVEHDAPLEIATRGRGDVYVTLQTTGLGHATPAADDGLLVRRAWSRNGEPVASADLRVGDLIEVTVTLSAEAVAAGRLDNLVIVDPLPAGLEIENPRLATSTGRATRIATRPDRIEFRDDRVLIFASIAPGGGTFRYHLRATTAGTFALPAIQARSMYDPQLASTHGAGRVVVR